jgi:hypothetical protein
MDIVLFWLHRKNNAENPRKFNYCIPLELVDCPPDRPARQWPAAHYHRVRWDCQTTRMQHSLGTDPITRTGHGNNTRLPQPSPPGPPHPPTQRACAALSADAAASRLPACPSALIARSQAVCTHAQPLHLTGRRRPNSLALQRQGVAIHRCLAREHSSPHSTPVSPPLAPAATELATSTNTRLPVGDVTGDNLN